MSEMFASPLDADESYDTYFQKEAEKMAKSDYAAVDYTVLSVVVVTLGLVILVEIIQHNLDHRAHGRPFFKTVLEAVYRELATLGIVEFFIFIIKKYYKDLNPGAKDVFADVHFMLFYAALFNAFQSAITAFFSTRNSYRLWVRTEQLELDHYIEIREEYERIDAILFGQDKEAAAAVEGSGRVKQDSSLSWNTDASANFAGYSLRKLRKSLYYLGKFLRYPHLYHQHAELLVQVRFHELRVHFLKANDLSLQFKVSEYLERCELQVLCKLVHISPFAWLLLTFAITLIYYFMSIVVDVTGGNLRTTGKALTAIYLGSMVAFVLVSIVIFYKMKWIFGRMMRMKLQDELRTGKQSQRAEKEISSQSALFWGNNPKYITILLQFMQFGFAIALAIILVFSDDINVKGAPLPLYAYILIVLFCYGAFVFMTGKVIPRYTLCTSLGQMVNQKRLQETLAEYHLEEVQRQRALKLEEDVLGTTVSWDGTKIPSLKKALTQSASERKLSVTPMVRSKTYEDLDFSETQTLATSTSTLLAELVETDTQSLRSNLVEREKRIHSSIEQRRSRRKVVSEGVAMMRSMDSSEDFAPSLAAVPDGSAQPDESRRRTERRKSSSANARMEHDFFLPAHDVADKAVSFAELGEAPSTAGDPTKETDSDDHSDVDDIPEVDKDYELPLPLEEHTPKLSTEQKARKYFSSRKYQIISAVFGTLCCFFVVGYRMESLLLKTGILKDKNNTWQMPLLAAFWLEVAFLACFLVGDLLLAFVFRAGNAISTKQRALFMSSIFDIILSSGCLAFLIVAETKRCCDSEVQETFDGDCCPTFGSRSYGGIGTIEPFTALIVVRVLRYPVAKKVVTFLHQRLRRRKSDPSSDEESPDALHPLDPFYDKKSHRDKHLKHSLDAKGSIVDLWKQAIGKYPDVVQAHGEFSGELLQAMLGIDIIPSTTNKLSPPDIGKLSDEESDLTSPTNDFSREVKTKVSRASKDEPSSSPKKADLTPIKETAEGSFRSITAGSPIQTSPEPLTRRPSQTFQFISPTARLIRSMRRCDRKLLPLLEEWMAVDVVMTKFEIVYFDAGGSESQSGVYTASIREALTSTHGGKGLRLKDVAEGRRVVGHLAISSIDTVHVERVLPHDERHLDHSLDEDEQGAALVQEEYWKTEGGRTMRGRGSSWQRIKEDRLKIHSVHGTLYLRFYKDLDDAMQNEERWRFESEDEGSLYKNNAFQWCQTLVRICGIEQLHHQKLPNFGEGDSEELRDYIEVVNPNESNVHRLGGLVGRLHRRLSSANLVGEQFTRRMSIASDDSGDNWT